MTTFAQFVEALVEPAKRAEIGLVISDDDARALIGNQQWAQDYFDKWSSMAPPAAPAPPATPPAPAFTPPPPVYPGAGAPQQSQPQAPSYAPTAQYPQPYQQQYPQQTAYPNPAYGTPADVTGAPPTSSNRVLWIILGAVGIFIAFIIVIAIVVFALIVPNATNARSNDPAPATSAPFTEDEPSATPSPEETPVEGALEFPDPSTRSGDTSGGYTTPFTDFEQWAIDSWRDIAGLPSSAGQYADGVTAADLEDVDTDLLSLFDTMCVIYSTDPAKHDGYVEALTGSYSEAEAERVVDVILEYCVGTDQAS